MTPKLEAAVALNASINATPLGVSGSATTIQPSVAEVVGQETMTSQKMVESSGADFDRGVVGIKGLGGKDKTSIAGDNLNQLHRAKATNMPFSAYSFAGHCDEKAALNALGIGAFPSDQTPLGDAWNRIILGSRDQNDIDTLQTEVAKTLKGGIKEADVPEVSQAIVDFAVSIREQRQEADEMIRRTIRNIR